MSGSVRPNIHGANNAALMPITIHRIASTRSGRRDPKKVNSTLSNSATIVAQKVSVNSGSRNALSNSGYLGSGVKTSSTLSPSTINFHGHALMRPANNPNPIDVSQMG